MTTNNTHVNTEELSERDMKLAMLNVAEEHAREYAGQSGSSNRHVDVHALGCIQGSARFTHEAFRRPIKVNTVMHHTTGESGESESETKHFIH